VRLGVALGGHTLAWEDLLDLVRRAEAAGFAAVYVDGDVSMLGRRHERDVLDGWTVTTALLAHTTRIELASIRLVHHWNPARLAQAAATVERITPGRLRFFASIGDRPEDPRFGLAAPSVRERIAWLDESLDAVRALWRGDTVTRDGRFVRLDSARVRPTPPPGSLPIEIGAKGRGLLGVVARHADVWNVNLPPIPGRVTAAARWLDDACGDLGRDPRQIRRSQWLFTRVQRRPDPSGALAEFRRVNPWFDAIPDDEVGRSLVIGDGASCRARLTEISRELSIDLPVLDLCGVDADTARRNLDAIPPGA
jgi:alkanesulfonate monooxygenase SsuD/methylene tetrahydromethanopterin reductase-like flavin-dependent oxidoreductase (luciferase family)